MYKQLDFDMKCSELNRAIHSPDFYKDYLTDLMDYASRNFDRTLPLFPFNCDETTELDIEIVKNSPKKKKKAFNLEKTLDELAKCKAEAESIPIDDADLQQCLFDLIEEVKRLAELFPEYFTECFEEMYSCVLHKLPAGNNRIKGDIIKLIGRIKKVHIAVSSAAPETVYGRYIPSRRRIELYAEPIRKAFWHDCDRTGFLLCVLTHELFHMWHHTYILNNCGKQSDGKKATAVKESLARYFEYSYARDCSEIRNDVEEKITRMTYPHMSLFPENPYHGAQYIDKKSFADILKISAYNMSDAFCVLNARHLLSEYDKGSFDNPI